MYCNVERQLEIHIFQKVILPAIDLCCSRTTNFGQPAYEKKDNAIELMKMHCKNMQYTYILRHYFEFGFPVKSAMPAQIKANSFSALADFLPRGRHQRNILLDHKRVDADSSL